PAAAHRLAPAPIVPASRPDAPAAAVSALTSTYTSLPNDPECTHARALLTPDPLLARQVTAVAANFVLEGDCVSPDAIRSFALAHRNHAPEDICDSGTRPRWAPDGRTPAPPPAVHPRRAAPLPRRPGPPPPS